ncbi:MULTISPECIES: outer membrane beta-barrel protein [unclassified Shinella]|uniref:outer membrane beta-barrel protein n=1 Tax=unclassified Shinella TaxID=2643062 RepID=UPI00225D09D0|nr:MULTISPECIES: outer membrane beta-barrel protein [unclassified Shinella]MCO5141407.1 outer membrane beta-barrel protein [Shinella sp.]MDC7256390.1 outer membrane beta-barrel protein [Shinella sp. YE25]CAI0339253.1 Outer membrane protein/protective antigen OMA87 [Rhizobiaceae bacterium]CAK7257664.1 Outer membrane beta-barrel protein [Shinella sp. WSC3-e]
MAEEKAKDRGARLPRLSWHLANLLLAGTVLAAAPAFAQQRVANETPTFQEPLDPLVRNTGYAADATLPGTETAAWTGPALTGDQAEALSEAVDGNAAIRRTEREGERLNLREGSTEAARSDFGDPYQPTGIRVGTFVLRPSITQSLGHERTKSGGTTSRTYSQTGFRGVLTSDWSRHQLTIDAEGIYQRNISGTGETEPQARINSDLRLDLSDDTIANLTAGYSFEREDSSDPNAIDGASAQSGVHGFTAGARVQRDFGAIRGMIGAEIEREVYGSAKLANGAKLRLSDRNFTEGTLTGRIGFELSPALIPYLEASIARSIYDEKRDSLGYERSSSTLGGRAGVEIDLGEKLRGDLGMGYKRAAFDDSRLKSIAALTLDGSVIWSPQRGTELRLGLGTQIEPSTTAGQSGYVDYATTAELTHELRENLVARLSGAYTWRDFSSSGGADQNVYRVGTSLTWDLNRWLALTGDVSYELTRPSRGTDTGITRAGIGLVLRR